MIGLSNVSQQYYWVIKKKRVVLMECAISIETKVYKTCGQVTLSIIHSGTKRMHFFQMIVTFLF